ncbi:hypothetical protein N7495_007804 [Penicillium taxi]|uniref:uncharacterized protein n=1 Tax=Penicillium taxi TaxID=168475 RepID=UPI0025459778|nr:uncharacterized protein N7495_007804 [Penicillium taxi]KAJ5887763.1 hypothetical protein N7495_007804 [Penicillium taxi]
MTGFLHKAEESMHFHHHHDTNKPNHTSNVTPVTQSDKHSNYSLFHKKHDDKHHLSQEERDRLEFEASRHYDHAKRESHGAGVNFEA